MLFSSRPSASGRCTSRAREDRGPAVLLPPTDLEVVIPQTHASTCDGPEPPALQHNPDVRLASKMPAHALSHDLQHCLLSTAATRPMQSLCCLHWQTSESVPTLISFCSISPRTNFHKCINHTAAAGDPPPWLLTSQLW